MTYLLCAAVIILFILVVYLWSMFNSLVNRFNEFHNLTGNNTLIDSDREQEIKTMLDERNRNQLKSEIKREIEDDLNW